MFAASPTVSTFQPPSSSPNITKEYFTLIWFRFNKYHCTFGYVEKSLEVLVGRVDDDGQGREEMQQDGDLDHRLKPGGPVILLSSGSVSCFEKNRIQFLNRVAVSLDHYSTRS